MYAIVDVKDKQFKVREDDTLYVPYHSDAEADQELTLDRVLLVSDEEGDATLGTPTVEDATVTARVLEHVKGDKVIVFKKKRRKRYRVKRGHRQQYTQIQIESLNVNGAAPSTEPTETADEEPDTESTSEPDAEPEPEDASDGASPQPDTADEDDTSADEPDASEEEDSPEASVDAEDESAEETAAEENTSAGTNAVDEAFSGENPFEDAADDDEDDPKASDSNA